MNEFASKLFELNKSWNLQLRICSEKKDLDRCNIVHNKCIEDDLMIDIFSEDEKFMDFLGLEISPPDLFGDGEVKKTKKLKYKVQKSV